VSNGGVSNGGASSGGVSKRRHVDRRGYDERRHAATAGNGGVETGIPNEGYAGSATNGATTGDSSGLRCRAAARRLRSAALILVGLVCAPAGRGARGERRAKTSAYPTKIGVRSPSPYSATTGT